MAAADRWVQRASRRALTLFSAAVLAMLALLSRVTPVAAERPLAIEETDLASSSSRFRSANCRSEGALCIFSFWTRCFHASAAVVLYMLYWRPLMAL